MNTIAACATPALIVAVLAWALAMFKPEYVDSMPDALKGVYSTPLSFALLMGVIALALCWVTNSYRNKASDVSMVAGADAYSDLLARDSYDY